MEGSQKPLELILARNLLTAISTPAFLVASDGELLFYNEAAGAMLGTSFEETGRMTAEEWTREFGPYAEDGEPIPLDELPLTIALRDGRPAHASLTVRAAQGEDHEIAASAMPIVSAEHGTTGAMVIFWPADPDRAREIATGRHEAVSQ